MSTDTKKVFQEVIGDVEYLGYMKARPRYHGNKLKNHLKEVNSQHQCDICKKISLEMCNLCSGCDTYSTWICNACSRDGDCPPCGVRRRMQKLKYAEMIKFEKLANSILNTWEVREKKNQFKYVLEQLQFFHYLKRRERESMIGRDNSINAWIKLLNKQTPLDSIW